LAVHDVSVSKPQSTPEAGQQAHRSELDSGTPGLEQPISAGFLLRLQRTAGNTAVNDLLRRRALTGKGASLQRSRAAGGSLAVQRHAEGEALPTESDMVGEISSKEAVDVGGGDDSGSADAGGGGGDVSQSTPPADGDSGGGDSSSATQDTGGSSTPQDADTQAPEATRSATQEATDKTAATAAGTAFKTALTPAAMSLAGAQSVLTGQFGGIKTIVPGSIVILADQPACSAKYDEVCMADHLKRPDGSDWKAGDRARDDAANHVQVEGFAWKGIVYVNGKTTLITATAHEMLHINTASNYRATMGETFNEGSTEFLARKAIAAAGITVPAVTAYPTQIVITQALIALVGEDVLTNAYFGGADSLTDAIKAKATGTWTSIRAKAEALNVDRVKELLAPMPASS
jgi:hypothetical protein